MYWTSHYFLYFKYIIFIHVLHRSKRILCQQSWKILGGPGVISKNRLVKRKPVIGSFWCKFCNKIILNWCCLRAVNSHLNEACETKSWNFWWAGCLLLPDAQPTGLDFVALYKWVFNIILVMEYNVNIVIVFIIYMTGCGSVVKIMDSSARVWFQLSNWW